MSGQRAERESNALFQFNELSSTAEAVARNPENTVADVVDAGRRMLEDARDSGVIGLRTPAQFFREEIPWIDSDWLARSFASLCGEWA